VKGLGLTGLSQQPVTKSKLVVGYIDRQNTDHRLPDEHHNWLMDYFLTHEKVKLLQLQMEACTGLEQVELASGCDLIIGMHGNGLTHALWMKPQRYVIEIYCRFNFHFDYATVAQLLKHKYLGIVNGKVIDRDMVARRDPALRKSLTRKESMNPPISESRSAFAQEGMSAIRDSIEKAIRELSIA
jgi:Glycosyltransferase 61